MTVYAVYYNDYSEGEILMAMFDNFKAAEEYKKYLQHTDEYEGLWIECISVFSNWEDAK